jgi:hypothetical protein
MIVNAFALAFTSLLILAGVWLTPTMSGGCLKPKLFERLSIYSHSAILFWCGCLPPRTMSAE